MLRGECQSKEERGESKEVFDHSAEDRGKIQRVLLRASLLSRRFDVHSSLQFKPVSRFDCVVLSFDLHNRDHVKALELLFSFRFRLPSIRKILPNLIDDQVKHVLERVKLKRVHVKLRRKLPCSNALELCSTANIAVPSAVAPGQSPCRVRFGEVDPALPRSVLLSSE